MQALTLQSRVDKGSMGMRRAYRDVYGDGIGLSKLRVFPPRNEESDGKEREE